MLDELGAIPIERGRGDYLAAALVLQRVPAGQAVVIFPQGAVRGNRVGSGAASSARALSRGKIGFPQLRVIIGEPIEVAQAPEDQTAALTERLRVAVESLA